MHKYKLHTFAALLIVLAISTSSLVIINQFTQSPAPVNAAETTCPNGNTILINNTAPTTSMTLPPGLHKVSLAVSSVLAPNVRSVVFNIDNGTSILGRGVQVSTNPYYEMQWQSQVTPGGQHSIGATIYMNSGSCVVPFVPIVLSNTTSAGSMTVTVTPPYFEGYTNEPRNFVLKAMTSGTSTAMDISPWAYFGLTSVSLGVVSPADGSNNFRFSAGPTAGQGAIKLAVQYGGNTTQTDIPVKVLAQTTTTATNTTTSGSTATGGTSTTTATSNSSPAALESDSAVKQCVVSKIGDARYTLITSGKERPTSTEFEAFNQCFAIRNYVIPSGWAPVAATKEIIQKTPTSTDVKVKKAENVTDTVNGTKKQSLRFSGKAKASTKVLIYIFSEPLVVTTSADGNGDWSYALEDPLEPGKHEAYALVSKGDGNYERSNVFSFAVAKAEAAPANPNGLSLNLERNQATATKSTTSLRLYIIGVVALLLLVGALGWNLWRIRSKKAAIPAQAPLPPNQTPIEPDKPGETIKPQDTDKPA